MTRARRRMKNGLTRFQIQARELTRRLRDWLDAGQPSDAHQFRLERLAHQARARRELREAGTRENARYFLELARLTPGVVRA